MATPERIVVLDRDGVINRDSPDYIRSSEEWLPLSGSLEAMARLQAAGYRLAIASNQSGLGRGLFSEATLDEIHDKLQAGLEACGGQRIPVFFCPHLPDAGCDCRKPGTGLLQQIEKHCGLSLVGASFVGDSMKDLQAASSSGMRPVLVRTGNGRDTELALKENPIAGITVFEDLAAFSDELLGLA